MDRLAFTITDAKTLAETWFDEKLEDAQVLVWGNEFIRRVVSNKLWTENSGEFSGSIAGVYYDLPTDFYIMVAVTNQADPTIEYDSNAYTISNGRIKFGNSGDYTVTFREYPSLLLAVTDDYPLPDAFVYPLAEYLIFRYFNIELDDEDCKAGSLEYEARVKSSLKNIYDEMQISSEYDSFQVKMRW